jgi:NAD(P)-dependent dehydrogenase (short-subunit alcohol dehydrogenase family)
MKSSPGQTTRETHSLSRIREMPLNQLSQKRVVEMLGLEGKSAIVTGASRGIGEAIARALVEADVNVVGVGRTFPANWESQFQDQQKISRLVGDVCDPRTADSAVRQCLDNFGNVNILVNNAGIVVNTGILDLNVEDWDRTIETNLKGMLYFSRAVAPELVKQKSGRVVNVSSVAADYYESGLLAYTTSKGAVNSFTRALAVDLAPHHVTVNAVAPGWVNTTMGAGSLPKEKLLPVLERIPLGHVASTDEIAGVVLFLCSDLSRYMTGQIVAADGGETIEGTIKGIQY